MIRFFHNQKIGYFLFSFVFFLVIYTLMLMYKSLIVFKKQNEISIKHIENTEINYAISDFQHYNCKDRRRIGGMSHLVSKTNDPLWRIDGAWFVCFDAGLAPINNKCNILSFGIHEDDSFDFDFNQNYGCNVFSFDPFVEAKRFTKIRDSDQTLKDSHIIQVNNKWAFYRTGVTGSNEKTKNQNKIGGIETLENVLKLTNMQDKVIDVFKMDIERSELDVLEHLNIDYACKYYKQFVLETHPESKTDQSAYKMMQKLKKCFLLFHRNMRFFEGEVLSDTGPLTG